MMPNGNNSEAGMLSQDTSESLGKHVAPRTNILPNDLRTSSDSFAQAIIMMVDDEDTTMDVMQVYLEDAGYQHFVLIEHSSQAIAKLEEMRPDILLLDLMMPEVSGFEILEQIRVHPLLAHLPVIILTSSSDATTKLKVLDLGATDFLSKPVDPSELTLRVRNTLAARAYQNQMAYYDSLTKLPNQSLFHDRLTWFLQRSERLQEKLVVLYITFDQLKHVSNTMAPQVGDQIIIQIAERMHSCIRNSDMIGHGRTTNTREIDSLFRVGRDEFSLLCPNMDIVEHATKIASRILKVMEKPFNANGTDVYLWPNIGIASFPADAKEMTSLIQCAASASDQAKLQDKGAFCFYSSDLNAKSLDRLELEADLRCAIGNNQLVLHYQPKVDVMTGQIKGVEALVRWQLPDGSLRFPDQFIPLAEDTDLIHPLGEWVLQEACAQMARWKAQGLKLQVAVNLSMKQFRSNNLVPYVSQVILNHGLDAQYLTLELTESLVMDNPEQAVKTLKQLIALGVKLSIDDFGTGYSSLSYLKRFPLHELKIDRSFLQDMTTDSEDRALVSAMIYLAHEFNLNVVAEGVENQEQLDMLVSLACDQYQGYFFSRPICEQDLAPMLSGLVTEVQA